MKPAPHPARFFLLVIAAALATGVVSAVAQQPTSIPSPRPTGWVVDQTGTLDASAIATLNALGNEVHARDGAELAVVVIPTTRGRDHRRFAADLFNHWGLGDRSRHNGLLVFVAINDRAAEIVLGDGIDSDADLVRSERIMQQIMVPQFRAGKPGAAVLDGAQACAREFFSVGGEPTTDRAVELERSNATTSASAPRTSTASQQGWRFWPGTIGGAMVVAVVGWIGGRSWMRHRRRRCPQCRTSMVRLDEAADDAHLTDAERVEERVRSVDYDIWHCPACGATAKLRYGRFFSGYAACPQCHAATLSSKSETIVAATTVSTGRLRVHEHCEACKHDNVYVRVIPVRTETKSRSSSGSSSSGFGGGRSSGRGASGRW
jgi:uncharacterized protein